MADAIRWYLCPLVPHPSGDPASPSVPHAWINQAGGSATTVALPGGQFCVLRLRADSAALDALVGNGAPTGFRRFPLLLTWGQLPAAVQTFLANRWPVATSAMQDDDRLGVLLLRLLALVRAGTQLRDLAQPASDGAADEA